jgi:hypothetical protein
MTDRRGSARVVAMTMATLGLAAGVLIGVVMLPSRQARGQDSSHQGPWTIHVERMDQALAQRDVTAAESAWRDAYTAALGTRERWDGPLEVGNAYLRIGQVTKGPKVAEPTARRLYLTALFRAQRLSSLDGVLKAAEAFAALGDRQVVEQCVAVAITLGRRSSERHDLERVQVARTRLAVPVSEDTTPDPGHSMKRR